MRGYIIFLKTLGFAEALSKAGHRVYLIEFDTARLLPCLLLKILAIDRKEGGKGLIRKGGFCYY